MSTKNKKGPNGGGVYLALALSILLVVCVGIYSLVVNMFAEVPNIDGDNELRDILSNKASNNNTSDKSVSWDLEPPEFDSEEANSEPDPVYSEPCSGNIIKEFSGNDLIFSETMNDYRAHTGIDVECNIGDKVCCFTNGTVEEISDDPLMGKTIIIDHGNNLKSVYQNLAEDIPSDIAVGAEVTTGQVIGAVGDTALIECAEKSHLHFELIESGEYISPAEFLY